MTLRCSTGSQRSAALCAALFLFLGAREASAATYEDIEITVQPQPAAEGRSSGEWVGGYLEYRITVRNRSTKVDHQVRLVSPADEYGYRPGGLRQNSKTILVPRRTAMTVPFFYPANDQYEERLAVEIDGRRQQELVPLSSPFSRSYSYSSSRPAMTVLSGRGIPQDYRDAVRSAYPNELVFCRSELDAADWSPNWLGYTVYDAIILTGDELEAMPAEVLLALRRYVESGGILLVHGENQIVPASLREPQTEPDSQGVFIVGFGMIRPAPAPMNWPSDFWQARSKSLIIPGDDQVELGGEVRVPVRALLGIVILFAAGVGPINIWLLSRHHRKMWIWWNVPAISCMVCLSIFVYSLFAEGVRGRTRTAVFTLLDENTHRATSLGYASFYCPLTPSDGLHFSNDTQVTLLDSSGHSDFDSHSRGQTRTIDWTRDQHLASGWVVSRLPACFAVRKNEPRRERLTIHRSAQGELSVVNGLGVDIEKLYYLDNDQDLGTAESLAPGEERTLIPHRLMRDSAAPPLRLHFLSPWNISLQELRASPEKYLRPGSYIAVVRQNPFLEDAIPQMPHTGSIGVIYGITAGAGHGH